MGAVSFSIDLGLVATLKKALPLDVFVETGTFQGDTVELVRDRFSTIHSVELSAEHYDAARLRFAGQGHIKLACGDSAEALAKWAPSLHEKSVLYFLDAHWCVADNTAGEASQCPLLDEIRAIRQLNEKSLIVIDDARLFLAPPLAPHEISHWPDLNAVLGALRAVSPSHQFMVLNDTILFFPPCAGVALREYAHQEGTDWLAVMSKTRDYDNLRAQFDNGLMQLQEKDRVIHEMQKICDARLNVIREQQAALNSIRRFSLSHRLGRLFGRHRYPKLGQLSHHAPIPLQSRGLPPVPDYRRAVGWPSISIVTPSYNQGGYIGRTMDSVLCQNYPNLEYFVQDGGSTDGTVDVLKLYSDRLSGWESGQDGGQSQAINLGLVRTRGEIMAWLNSDDLLLPGTLAYVADYFARHPEVDVVYGHRILIDEQDQEIGRWILPRHDGAALLWADFIPQETLFWRRSIWEKAGGQIDESFRFAMDWDLLLRFRKVGARMVRLPYFLGAFRIHEAQKTSAAINDVGMQEMDRLRLRELGRLPSRSEIKRALAPYLLRHIVSDLTWRVLNRLGLHGPDNS
jgi:GT2 family glycosyltransferase